MTERTGAFLTLCILAVGAVLHSSTAGAQARATSADQRLRALYTAEWTWRQREFARSDASGDGGRLDRLPRVDGATQQSRLAYWERVLRALDSIPFDRLSAEEKVNAQVFRTSIRELANDVRFRTYETPFNSDSFFWTEFTPRQGFASPEAYRSYLGRLRDVPGFFNEHIANMRAGGFSVARARGVGSDLHRWPRRPGKLPDEHILPPCSHTLHARSADTARVHSGS